MSTTIEVVQLDPAGGTDPLDRRIVTLGEADVLCREGWHRVDGSTAGDRTDAEGSDDAGVARRPRNKPELLAYARERDVEVEDGFTRGQIIEALDAAGV